MSTKLSVIILGLLSVVVVLQLCIVFKLWRETKGNQVPHPDMTQAVLSNGSTNLHEPKQTTKYRWQHSTSKGRTEEAGTDE